MIDKNFSTYIEEALKEYREYKKYEKKGDFSFRDFLLIIQIWKIEQILEALEDIKK